MIRLRQSSALNPKMAPAPLMASTESGAMLAVNLLMPALVRLTGT